MQKQFRKINLVLLLITVIFSFSCSDDTEDIIDDNDIDIGKDNITMYVSENKIGRGNGSSETDAADYLDDNFWIQVNKDLKTKEVEVKFLSGNYSRAFTNKGLLLKGIGNKKNRLIISGNKDVVFHVVEGHPKGASNLIYLNGCQNILMRDFHFTGNGSTGYVLAIRSNPGLPASENIAIKNCTWKDMGGVIYGATGCHGERTKNITYKDCVFERVGVDVHSHMMYHAHQATNINMINCHFEDCEGDYVRFRDRSDYGLIKNCVFIRNNKYPIRPFIGVPIFNNVDPGDEYLATNFSFVDNKFINNAATNTKNAIYWGHWGFSPKEYNYLLTDKEGSLLMKGSPPEKIKLLKDNFGIDVKKIRLVNNSYTVRITNHVVLISKANYGAVSRGWEGEGNITDLMSKSEVPFEWEPK